MGVYLKYRHSSGSFDPLLFWLRALPFGVGLVAEAHFSYSWRLADLKGFRYDPDTQEARWEEDGTIRVFRIDLRQPVPTASLDGDAIRILRAGKHTLTRLQYENGMPEDTLLRIGQGTFLPGEFPDLPAAQASAADELVKDRSALLYIVSGATILDTLMDREQQRRLNRQAGRRHAVVSTVVVCGTAFCISVFALQLPTILAHTVFAGVMTLIYIVLLRLCGTRNYDALILMAIIFVMLTILSTTIRK